MMNYIKISTLIILTFFIYLWLGPWLLSEPSDLCFIGGIALMVCIWPSMLWFKTGLKEFLVTMFNKTSIILCIVAISLLSLSGCHKVPAGYVGLRVNLLGGSKGEIEKLGIGSYMPGVNTKYHNFPTFSQNYVWTKDPTEGSTNDESLTFQDMDGMEISTDMGITYHLDQDQIVELFQRYRRSVEEITDTVLRSAVRDALANQASKLKVEDIYGPKKEDLLKATQTVVTSEFSKFGIIVEKLYWVGSMRLPAAITDSINNKVKAAQIALQTQMEIQQAKAEAEKKIAEAHGLAEARIEQANAEAKANLTIAESVTPELVRYLAIKNWDGKLPQITGNGGIPLINFDLNKTDNAERKEGVVPKP